MLDNERAAAELASVLAWYRDMGVDAAVGDVPVDWTAKGDAAPGAGFAKPQQARAAVPSALKGRPDGRAEHRAPPAFDRPAPPAPPRQQRIAMPAPDEAVTAARAAAQGATALAELGEVLARFEGCALKATAKNLCFFRGAERARLMIIGEAPGRDEDQVGKPFVGRAGQLLDKMLAAIGLGEQDAHITNVVYWRPPGNRTPTPLEAQVCRPFLERQIELVAPELVLLLGGAAAKHIFDVPDGIMRIRGRVKELQVGAHAMRGLATLHPAYLLRTPAAKRLAWRDLLLASATLALPPAAR
jgi:DNA polymerase